MDDVSLLLKQIWKSLDFHSIAVIFKDGSVRLIMENEIDNLISENYIDLNLSEVRKIGKNYLKLFNNVTIREIAALGKILTENNKEYLIIDRQKSLKFKKGRMMKESTRLQLTDRSMVKRENIEDCEDCYKILFSKIKENQVGVVMVIKFSHSLLNNKGDENEPIPIC